VRLEKVKAIAGRRSLIASGTAGLPEVTHLFLLTTLRVSEAEAQTLNHRLTGPTLVVQLATLPTS
jgi:hypothetical protein